jgi:hypothetical protein
LEQPRQVHLVATKHVLRYLKGTLDHGLWYRSDHEFGLHGYSDSDWADSISNCKSTLGYCFSLGSSMSRGAVGSSHVWHSVWMKLSM